MHHSPATYYFLILKSKYSPQYPVLKHFVRSVKLNLKNASNWIQFHINQCLCENQGSCKKDVRIIASSAQQVLGTVRFWVYTHPRWSTCKYVGLSICMTNIWAVQDIDEPDGIWILLQWKGNCMYAERSKVFSCRSQKSYLLLLLFIIFWSAQNEVKLLRKSTKSHKKVNS